MDLTRDIYMRYLTDLRGKCRQADMADRLDFIPLGGKIESFKRPLIRTRPDHHLGHQCKFDDSPCWHAWTEEALHGTNACEASDGIGRLKWIFSRKWIKRLSWFPLFALNPKHHPQASTWLPISFQRPGTTPTETCLRIRVPTAAS